MLPLCVCKCGAFILFFFLVIFDFGHRISYAFDLLCATRVRVRCWCRCVCCWYYCDRYSYSNRSLYFYVVLVDFVQSIRANGTYAHAERMREREKEIVHHSKIICMWWGHKVALLYRVERTHTQHIYLQWHKI